jgi:type I restriction enzyme, R subunit
LRCPGTSWFKQWRTIGGRELAPDSLPQIQVIIQGLLSRQRLLDLIQYFIVFEDDGGGRLDKKVAGYHQFHAVNFALEETLRAAQPPLPDGPMGVAEGRGVYVTGGQHGGELGDRRVGVVWHTQGSGKSLTMAFYAGRVIRERAMQNPTIVVLTDRNDLDDQLFGVFSRCQDVLRQPPVQAESRADLRSKLSVNAGGVVFTTIQKFWPDDKGDRHPVLTDRRNVVVLADEAHRSQYGFAASFDERSGELSSGLAQHMRDALPNASFIAFTGTPIELGDRSTKGVFGDYISVYDMERAINDEATVPIYYESRLAKLALDEDERPKIDPSMEEVTEGEEAEVVHRLMTKWAQTEALVGSEKRLELVASDIVEHFDKRLEVMEGKAMIVCMSRRICVDLYDELVALRPEWGGTDDNDGVIKIVMTGSAADSAAWQQHIRSPSRREALAKRFRDPNDPFKVVIVRDMWLTGFDAPSLHTMYIDKPMHGHNLMQAIARVNRVFRSKRGGLVVDYLGLAHELRNALATYVESGGRGQAVLEQDEAVAAALKYYEVCANLFHGFDWTHWVNGSPQQRLSLLPAAQEHVLSLDDGKKRFLDATHELATAFALSMPDDRVLAIRADVAFFQAVRAALSKKAPSDERSPEDLDYAIRQIVSRSVSSEGVIDIFEAAGLDRPDISILSDQFLAEIRSLPLRNVAVELLRKLLAGEVKSRERKNLIQGRLFSEMLTDALRRYDNRAIQAAQVIEELITIAKEMREANARGDTLGLTEEELAFYDALETNDSAVQILGDETLCFIARELVEAVRRNTTIDWTMRENVQAQIRVMVKRILRKYGYPPDLQAKATETVLEQARRLAEEAVVMIRA